MSNEENPLVSVTCMTYNQESYISQAIESFLSQKTKFPFEIVIGEDGSTDKTREIVLAYQKQYPGIIKVITSEKNVGSRQNGLRIRAAAKGKYLAICDGDDYWTDPHKLQIQANFLEANSDYVVCYHDAIIVDESGKIMNTSKLPEDHKRDFSSEELKKAKGILTLSMFFRNVVKDYPEEYFYVYNGDTFLTCLLGKFGKGKYLGEIKPAAYRHHRGGVWAPLNPLEKSLRIADTYAWLYAYYLKGGEIRFADYFSFAFKNIVREAVRNYPEDFRNLSSALTGHTRINGKEILTHKFISGMLSQLNQRHDKTIVGTYLQQLDRKQKRGEGQPERFMAGPSVDRPTEGAASPRARRSPVKNSRNVERILFVNHNIPPYEYSGTPISTLNHALGMAARGIETGILIPSFEVKKGVKKEIKNDLVIYKIRALNKYRAFLGDIEKEVAEEQVEAYGQILADFQPTVVQVNDYVYMSPKFMEIFQEKGCFIVRSVCNDEEFCHFDYPVVPSGLDSRVCSGPSSSKKCAECYWLNRLKMAPAEIGANDFENLKNRFEQRFAYIKNLYDKVVDRAIFTEAKFRDHFVTYVPIAENKIRIIPRGVSFDFERKLSRLPGDGKQIRFAFIGNLMFSKGINVVLRAFERISALDGFVLSLYGAIVDREYLTWVRKLEAAFPGKITYKGSFKKNDLPSILAKVDVGVVPSYFDTYNRVVREMLYCGIPVIATDFFGSSVIQNDINGIKIPIGDFQALSASMQGLIQNPRVLKDLSVGAQKTEIQSLDQEIDALLSTYQEIVSSGAETSSAVLREKKEFSGSLNSGPTQKIRAIAFYLPQFHPIQENDRWWGKGFTEWTNVAKAKPLFPGHYQPHVPADLGFYDLRLPEARIAQADMAREYGLYGFCYYHYWFQGKMLLETPIREVLKTGQPDFPFCLCWANENWTRVWNGGSKDILISQEYSEKDDAEHIRYLCEIFRDRRYIRIHGKPLFLVYRPRQFPNPLRTASIWRDAAKRGGVGELFLCQVESFPEDYNANPMDIGFDASVEFQPDWYRLGPKETEPLYRGLTVFRYEQVIKNMLTKPQPPYRRFPCVTPSWDNSPRRRETGVIFRDSSPALYERWLQKTIQRVKENPVEEQVVFINAWNEWGEGNHLEPDQKHGRAFLEATKNALWAIEVQPENPQVQEDAIEGFRPGKEAALSPRLSVAEERIEKGLTSIIILTYNQWEYTEKCLRSIERNTRERCEIIVVDNGSSDGTTAHLQNLARGKTQYKLIVNPKNEGFAKGCNQGIREAKGEFLSLLNNDVLVTENWLSGLRECLDSASQIGIVGPMTNEISGIQRIPEGSYQSIENLDEFAREFRERNRNRRIPSRRIVGFCMLFRRELIEKIGLLDESFGTGNFEDDDFCLRAELAGFANMIAGDVFVHHYGSRSFIGNKIDYRSAMSGNRKLFFNKWNGINPQTAEGKKLLALREEEKAWEAYFQDRPEESSRRFLKALKTLPQEEELYLSFAEMLLDLKRHQDALDILKSTAQRKQGEPQYVLMGYCLEGIGKIEEAEEMTGKALFLKPNSPRALNLKGVLAYRRGQKEEAAAVFQKAIQTDPGYGEPYTNLGVMEWEAGGREKALDFLERGFILSPTGIDNVRLYHSAASELGTFERAEKALSEAEALHPGHKKIQYLLTDILLRQGKNEAALEKIEASAIHWGMDEGLAKVALEIRNRINPKVIRRADGGERAGFHNMETA
jgi:GT2 family glycosyltransferase/glycosyltransferase involved in cell wall biosynthesis